VVLEMINYLSIALTCNQAIIPVAPIALLPFKIYRHAAIVLSFLPPSSSRHYSSDKIIIISKANKKLFILFLLSKITTL